MVRRPGRSTSRDQHKVRLLVRAEADLLGRPGSGAGPYSPIWTIPCISSDAYGTLRSMGDQGTGGDGAALTPVGYAVLGTLEQSGPASSYELKHRIAETLGPIWSFPHSQLYSEPPRLVDKGLVVEEREMQGRRRRIYTITEPGRKALRAWFSQPARAAELRDPALLQLFFGGLAKAGQLYDLARSQEQAHEANLERYESLESDLEEGTGSAHQAQVVRMALLYEELAVDFWSETAARFGGAGTDLPQQGL